MERTKLLLCTVMVVATVAGSALIAGTLLQNQAPKQGTAVEQLAAPSDTSLDVTYSVTLSGVTGFLEGLTHRVSLNISATVPEFPANSNETRHVTVLFVANNAQAFAAEGVKVSLTSGPASIPSYEPVSSVGQVQTYTFTLPDSAGTYEMSLSGTLSEYSVLGESGAEIPYQAVAGYLSSNSSTITAPSSYILQVQIPAGLHLLTFYSFTKGLSYIGNVPYQSYTLNGTEYVSTNYFVAPHGAIFADVITLLYASGDVYLYAAEIAAVLVAVLLYPIWVVWLGRSRRYLSRIMAWMQRITPRQLLTIFVLGCLLTVAFSFVVGPNPNQRVYVMGTDQATLTVGQDIRANTPFVPIYETQVEENSATVSTLGGFAAIVVVDPTIGNPDFSLVPYATSSTAITLAGPTHVIIYTSTPSSLNASNDFDLVATSLYGGDVKVVTTPTEVVNTLNGINTRQNPLGLSISAKDFRYSEEMIALLSFVLAFLAMAFLASKLAEIGLQGGWLGVAEALGYAFFAFAFLQMIYIASSVFLAVPLGLHSGNPQITAAGTLPGLAGGGSRPRELAGVVGFVFGALTRTKSGVKIDRAAIIIALAAALFLIIDPLTNGIIFHELVLALTAGATQGPAAQAIDFVGGLLFNIGNAFGSLASQWYFIQRGLILYFAGAVAFVIVPKLQRTTGTLLLLFSALLAGDGIVRVADMVPLKTMASTIPGFMAALLVIAAFLLAGALEKFLRGHLGRIGNAGS